MESRSRRPIGNPSKLFCESLSDRVDTLRYHIAVLELSLKLSRKIGDFPNDPVQGQTLGLLAAFFGGLPTLIWPWEESNYPSRSCNGLDGPKGPN